MWVYRELGGSGMFEVGFWEPVAATGEIFFTQSSVHKHPDDAAARVNYLNGGSGHHFVWREMRDDNGS